MNVVAGARLMCREGGTGLEPEARCHETRCGWHAGSPNSPPPPLRDAMRYAVITISSIAALVALMDAYGHPSHPSPINEPQWASVTAITRPVWASAMGKDEYGTWADLRITSATQRFRLIPAGMFTMGCDDAEADAAWKSVDFEKPREWYQAPQHTVMMSRPFWLADSACTSGILARGDGIETIGRPG